MLVVPIALLLVQTPASLIVGTWHGASTCADPTVDTSCHDEEVIYEVDSAAGPNGPVRMAADRIVDGKRVPMGDLRLSYDSVTQTWVLDMTMRLPVRWTFEPKENVMTGTLVELPSQRLIRRVAVRRTRGSGPPLPLPPCPGAADTLSLLQPGDSAYQEAPVFTSFLRRHGFVVRCVTRSTSAGTADLWRVAGFQTDRGPITVFFLRRGDGITWKEEHIGSSYRYTFTRAGLKRRYIERTNGPIYYMRHGTWLVQVFDGRLATTLRDIFHEQS